MSLILNIDTAVKTSSVCLARDGQSIAVKINPSQKDSAAWLHPGIRELLQETNTALHQLEAIAVSEGPGSYTGLRVGMATAKGLCYALNKPLIAINTLKLMANAAGNTKADLLCPMIDARRMEVFTAVFDRQLNLVLPPASLILDETCFQDILRGNTVLFFGDGSTKFQPVVKNHHAVFATVDASAEAMASLSYQHFLKREFSDIAYSHPFYGKDFHSSIK